MKRELKVSDTCEDAPSTLKELKLGYLNLADGLFNLAQDNFDIVIVSDPYCADAFWGLMLTKCKIKNEEELFKYPMKHKDVVLLKEYENAMTYADETQRKTYNYLLSEIKKVNLGNEY